MISVSVYSRRDGDYVRIDFAATTIRHKIDDDDKFIVADNAIRALTSKLPVEDADVANGGRLSSAVAHLIALHRRRV
jgi:hypothetical protein